MDSGQNPVEALLWGLFGWTRNCYVNLYYMANQNAESRVILVGRSNWNILYLSPLCQTLSNAFSTSRKAATICSPLLKLTMMDWDSLNRWSLVDLALLKPD